MTLTRIFIIADDLTGANDTAIQFRKSGFSTLVVANMAQAEPDVLKDYDVISINTDSRGMPPDDAYRTVFEALETLQVTKNGFFVYKKVDSMLRGNPGRELAAVMDVLDIPLTLVAPAFPANRSILENGLLPSGANAIRIFVDGSQRKTANIPLELIRQGASAIVNFINDKNSNGTQVFVADAVNDADLETIYAASTCLGKPHILTGSAGLANQIARVLGNAEWGGNRGSRGNRGNWGNDERSECRVKLLAIRSKEEFFSQRGKNRGKEDNPLLSPPTLIIAGSRQPETATQILTLSQHLSIPIIRVKTSLVLEGKSDMAIKDAQHEAVTLIHRNIPVCIIAVESMFHTDTANQHYTEGDESGKAISNALGILTKNLFADFHFPLLISTGGDTSMEICKHLSISCIEPLKEICPGIPLARIVSTPYNHHFIITKSGRFGEPDTLVKILECLNNLRQ